MAGLARNSSARVEPPCRPRPFSVPVRARRALIASVWLLCVLIQTTAGCGQKGDLYLPEKEEPTSADAQTGRSGK